MIRNNFTYVLIIVAVIAIGLSIKLYTNSDKNQSHMFLSTVGSLLSTPIQSSETSVSSPKNTTVISSKNSTKSNVIAQTQSASVNTSTPQVSTTQTPVTVPVAPVIIFDPITLPYEVDNFSSKGSWQALMGSLRLKFVDGPYKRNLLTIASTSAVDGIAELGGSEAWVNYSYILHANFISGPTFSLIGRFSDNKNYLKCVYSQGGITRIDAVVNGKTTTLTQNGDQIPTIPNVGDVDYKLTVNKDQIGCAVNGSTVSATIPTGLSSGGIGFDAYNSTPGSSELDVKDFSVSSL
ncbi:MAG TPA: hypothetical protein VL576_01050 [Candidatus Paceibacterota bacterium]|jgi:hypothetical protein|nr:hypothetical protein [Candidatus Paceibacterota bacterium]